MLRARLEHQEQAVAEFRGALVRIDSNQFTELEVSTTAATVRRGFGEFYSNEATNLLMRTLRQAKTGELGHKSLLAHTARVVAFINATAEILERSQNELEAPHQDRGELFQKALAHEKEMNAHLDDEPPDSARVV
jgi:hypothetical protein